VIAPVVSEIAHGICDRLSARVPCHYC